MTWTVAATPKRLSPTWTVSPEGTSTGALACASVAPLPSAVGLASACTSAEPARTRSMVSLASLSPWGRAMTVSGTSSLPVSGSSMRTTTLSVPGGMTFGSCAGELSGGKRTVTDSDPGVSALSGPPEPPHPPRTIAIAAMTTGTNRLCAFILASLPDSESALANPNYPRRSACA